MARAKLTPELVAGARARWRQGETGTAIAESLGLSLATVSRALRSGHNWRHVGGGIEKGEIRGFSPQDAAALVASRQGGESVRAMATRLGIGRVRMANVLRRLGAMPGRVPRNPTTQTEEARMNEVMNELEQVTEERERAYDMIEVLQAELNALRNQTEPVREAAEVAA